VSNCKQSPAVGVLVFKKTEISDCIAPVRRDVTNLKI
jgi:hypothetical protein